MRKKKIQEKLMILNLSHGITSLLLKNIEACGKPFAGGTAEFVSSEFQKSQSNKEATLEHFFVVCHTISNTEAVYDMVRKAYERPAGDSMEDLNVNMAFW